MSDAVPLGGGGAAGGRGGGGAGRRGGAAGYSGTPLARKLGIKAGHRVALVDPPADLDESLGVLPEGTVLAHRLGPADVVLFFTTSRAALERARPALGDAVFPRGALWVCWPKKAARVATDVTEGVVREVVLPHGLVDVKVCAVDAVWSGLKLVWRTERR